MIKACGACGQVFGAFGIGASGRKYCHESDCERTRRTRERHTAALRVQSTRVAALEAAFRSGFAAAGEGIAADQAWDRYVRSVDVYRNQAGGTGNLFGGV